MLLKQKTLEEYKKKYGREIDKRFSECIEEVLRNLKHFGSLEEACKQAILIAPDGYITILKAPLEYSDGGRFCVCSNDYNFEHLIRLAGFDVAKDSNGIEDVLEMARRFHFIQR